MKLKTILHSELAQSLARMAADKVLSHDVVSEILILTHKGVLPEGASHADVIQQAADGAKILDELNQMRKGKEANMAEIGNGASESPKPHESGFKFGDKSKLELYGDANIGKAGVYPPMAAVVNLALRRSTRDFTVYEGSRTLAKQKEYLAKGTTKTLKSAHLPQADGTSHAVDLVPIVNGVPSWASWEAIYEVALAMDQAATELGVAEHIVWGCAWDRRLSDFGGNVNEYAKAAMAYGDRQRAAGNQHPLIDGPHFEWRG